MNRTDLRERIRKEIRKDINEHKYTIDDIQLIIELSSVLLPLIIGIGISVWENLSYGFGSLITKIATTVSPEVRRKINLAKQATKLYWRNSNQIEYIQIMEFVNKLQSDPDVIRLLKIIASIKPDTNIMGMSKKEKEQQKIREQAIHDLAVHIKEKYPEIQEKLLGKVADALRGE